jgi:hypothetical protein
LFLYRDPYAICQSEPALLGVFLSPPVPSVCAPAAHEGYGSCQAPCGHTHQGIQTRERVTNQRRFLCEARGWRETDLDHLFCPIPRARHRIWWALQRAGQASRLQRYEIGPARQEKVRSIREYGRYSSNTQCKWSCWQLLKNFLLYVVVRGCRSLMFVSDGWQGPGASVGTLSGIAPVDPRSGEI